jgi:hypothetical protein
MQQRSRDRREWVGTWDAMYCMSVVHESGELGRYLRSFAASGLFARPRSRSHSVFVFTR